MQAIKNEFQAYQALANNKKDCPIAKAYAQKQAKAMKERLASLSFAERLKMQIEG